MQAKSYTRLTLGLDIVSRILDGPCAGYHELGIVKHRISLCDTITVRDAPRTTVECTHPDVPCDERNICYRAVELVRTRYAVSSSVAVTLRKEIPVMGGLAGGSANAATVVGMLNEVWQLRLAPVQLMELGRELGMDVPFFFGPPTAYDTETTGVLTGITTPLSLVFVLAVIVPGISTSRAYAGIDYRLVGRGTAATHALIEGLRSGDADAVRRNVHNDFEHSVFPVRSDIVAVRDAMLAAGAQASWMSGSGSTVVGLVGDREQGERVAGAVRRLPGVSQGVVVGSHGYGGWSGEGE